MHMNEYSQKCILKERKCPPFKALFENSAAFIILSGRGEGKFILLSVTQQDSET